MSTRAQVVPIVLPCSACNATVNIAVAMVKRDGVPEWRYELPARCRQCGNPMNTPAFHADVRATAKEFL